MEVPKSILLIDDDNISNYLISLLLGSVDCKLPFFVAANVSEAIQYINSLKNSSRVLILLDIHMPVLDGFEFLTTLKEMRIIDVSLLEIVIISSSIAEKDLKKAKEIGVSKFLTKPLNKEDLQVIINDFQFSGNSTELT